MNSLPADPGFAPVAVACPRCHAAIAVPATLFGQAAACPICTAGFMAPMPAPQVMAPQAMAPQAMPPQAMPPQAMPSVEPELRPLDTSNAAPQTIRHGRDSIELRRLTPEEKAVRRVRRNIITIGAGTAILFGIVLVATRFGRKPKRKR